MSRARKQLEKFIENNESLRNVTGAKKLYDNAWRKFIDSHENYIRCLDSEEKKKEACLNYEELMAIKVSVDGRATEWITRAKESAERRGECVQVLFELFEIHTSEVITQKCA